MDQNTPPSQRSFTISYAFPSLTRLRPTLIGRTQWINTLGLLALLVSTFGFCVAISLRLHDEAKQHHEAIPKPPAALPQPPPIPAALVPYTGDLHGPRGLTAPQRQTVIDSIAARTTKLTANRRLQLDLLLAEAGDLFCQNARPEQAALLVESRDDGPDFTPADPKPYQLGSLVIRGRGGKIILSNRRAELILSNGRTIEVRDGQVIDGGIPRPSLRLVAFQLDEMQRNGSIQINHLQAAALAELLARGEDQTRDIAMLSGGTVSLHRHQYNIDTWIFPSGATRDVRPSDQPFLDPATGSNYVSQEALQGPTKTPATALTWGVRAIGYLDFAWAILLCLVAMGLLLDVRGSRGGMLVWSLGKTMSVIASLVVGSQLAKYWDEPFAKSAPLNLLGLILPVLTLIILFIPRVRKHHAKLTASPRNVGPITMTTTAVAALAAFAVGVWQVVAAAGAISEDRALAMLDLAGAVVLIGCGLLCVRSFRRRIRFASERAASFGSVRIATAAVALAVAVLTSATRPALAGTVGASTAGEPRTPEQLLADLEAAAGSAEQRLSVLAPLKDVPAADRPVGLLLHLMEKDPDAQVQALAVQLLANTGDQRLGLVTQERLASTRATLLPSSHRFAGASAPTYPPYIPPPPPAPRVATWDERDPREVDGFRRWSATMVVIILAAAMCRMNRIRSEVEWKATPATPPTPAAALPMPAAPMPSPARPPPLPVLPVNAPPIGGLRRAGRGAAPMPVLPLEEEPGEPIFDADEPPTPPTQPASPTSSPAQA